MFRVFTSFGDDGWPGSWIDVGSTALQKAGRLDLLKSLRDAMRLLPGWQCGPQVQNELPEIIQRSTGTIIVMAAIVAFLDVLGFSKYTEQDLSGAQLLLRHQEFILQQKLQDGRLNPASSYADSAQSAMADAH